MLGQAPLVNELSVLTFLKNLTADRHLAFLKDDLVPTYTSWGIAREDLWFQRDVIQAHFGVALGRFLDAAFSNRPKGSRGVVKCIRRSPDFSPLDFSLDHLKSRPSIWTGKQTNKLIFDLKCDYYLHRLLNAVSNIYVRLEQCQLVNGLQFGLYFFVANSELRRLVTYLIDDLFGFICEFRLATK